MTVLQLYSNTLYPKTKFEVSQNMTDRRVRLIQREGQSRSDVSMTVLQLYSNTLYQKTQFEVLQNMTDRRMPEQYGYNPFMFIDTKPFPKATNMFLRLLYHIIPFSQRSPKNENISTQFTIFGPDSKFSIA